MDLTKSKHSNGKIKKQTGTSNNILICLFTVKHEQGRERRELSGHEHGTLCPTCRSVHPSVEGRVVRNCISPSRCTLPVKSGEVSGGVSV